MIKKILNTLQEYRQRKRYEVMIPIVHSALSAGIDYEAIRDIYKLDCKQLDDFIGVTGCYRFQRLNSLQTLMLTHSIKKFIKEFKESMLKALLYPISLIFIAILMLFFYGYKFGPSLRTMIEGYSNTNSFALQIYIIRVIVILISLVLLVILTLFISLCFKEVRIILYSILSKYSGFGLVKETITYLFSMCFLFILSLDISTFDSISELRSLRSLTFVSWLSYHLDEQLKKGLNIIEIFDIDYFSKTFVLLVKQGLVTGELASAVSKYIKLAETKITVRINRLGMYIKTLAYLVIIVVVFLFYSGLFMPLKLLEGLV